MHKELLYTHIRIYQNGMQKKNGNKFNQLQWRPREILLDSVDFRNYPNKLDLMRYYSKIE